MQAKYVTTRPWQTKKLAECLAKEILKRPLAKKAVVIALFGGLGSGKTTFLQGFARGTGIKEKVLSPTFILMRKFQLQASSFKLLYHIDCYRIKKPKEILGLGFKEIISNPKNIVAIEWADRVKQLLPKNCLRIKFELLSKTKRCVKVGSL